jgi:hypothetical protein
MTSCLCIFFSVFFLPFFLCPVSLVLTKFMEEILKSVNLLLLYSITR